MRLRGRGAARRARAPRGGSDVIILLRVLAVNTSTSMAIILLPVLEEQ